MPLTWSNSTESLNWNELAALYRAAPLGNKNPADLKVAFNNSKFVCLAREGEKLVGVGRALADGVRGYDVHEETPWSPCCRSFANFEFQGTQIVNTFLM